MFDETGRGGPFVQHKRLAETGRVTLLCNTKRVDQGHALKSFSWSTKAQERHFCQLKLEAVSNGISWLFRPQITTTAKLRQVSVLWITSSILTLPI